MSDAVYELQEWESWEIPGEKGRPARVRITTDTELPFARSDLLTACIGAEGIEFQAKDAQIVLILTPMPQAHLRMLLEQSVKFFLPVVLTEVDFDNNAQRTWLASPTQPRCPA